MQDSLFLHFPHTSVLISEIIVMQQSQCMFTLPKNLEWDGLDLTCTVCRMTHYRFDKLVDVVISNTCFHLNRRWFIQTAVVSPVSTHFASDHSVSYPWVSPDKPQRRVRATHLFSHAPLRHLDGFSTVEETVPALPLHAAVTNNFLGGVVCGSPDLVKCGVVMAGVNACFMLILTRTLFIFKLAEGVE